MIPAEVRTEIVEKVHNIMDLLCDYPDLCLAHHCERMLNRLDVLAGMDMEDYE
jgi:hypothetical protein